MRYVCSRCGMEADEPLKGNCPYTDLPHRFIRKGRRYRCISCGLIWERPFLAKCMVRYGLSDPYHVFVAIDERGNVVKGGKP